MSDQTALNYWSEKQAQHALLVEFLEWLESNLACELGPQTTSCPFTRLDDFKPDRLADRFLNIDRAKLERERRRLLDVLTERRLTERVTMYVERRDGPTERLVMHDEQRDGPTAANQA